MIHEGFGDVMYLAEVSRWVETYANVLHIQQIAIEVEELNKQFSKIVVLAAG